MHFKMQQFQDNTQNHPKTTANIVGVYELTTRL